MNAVVRVTDLRVRTREAGALIVDGVDLEIQPGEVVGLMGPSGSGKTTLGLSLVGHLRPGLVLADGGVRVGDLDPFQHPRRVRRRIVSFLGQDPAAELNPARRIGSLLMERAADAARPMSRTEVGKLLETLGLPGGGEFWRRRPFQISGGQARRVAIALVLCNRPRVLVLDEPTAGLDPAAVATVSDLVEHRPPGCSVLLVSHDRPSVEALADRCLHLRDGRIVEAPEFEQPMRAAAVQSGRVVLRVRGLSARHGRGPVIGPINLDVRAGSSLALCGPSGAGKSTLARCLAGLHPWNSGAATLDGRELAPTRRPRRDRQAIALVSQNSVDALNPFEDVMTALLRPLLGVAGLARAAAERRASELLEQVRLGPSHGMRRPAALSGGERQRVNLARALACEPSVLLCDEITSALDEQTGRAVLDLVDELRREAGLAVVLITHDRSEVDRYAQDVVRLPAL